MPNIKLEVPTLVRDITVEGKPYYYLRPLFTSHPVATNRRFEQAISQYKSELRHYFKGFVLQRENANHLLWYMFRPEVTFEQPQLLFKIGNLVIDGTFSVVHFSLQRHTFIYLPGLQDFMFIGNPSKDGKVRIREEVKRVIKKILQNKKAQQGNDFKAEDYFSSRREFITHVNVNVNVGLGKFKFEQQDDNWFFSRLHASMDFDGEIEIERVGQNLNNRYPANLQRAYFREDQARRIYQLLFLEGSTSFVLVGEKGVGKHTLVQEAMWQYLSREETKGRRARIWHIDPTRIIAGMSYVGMWQKRFEAIIDFVRKSGNREKADKILFDNPVALLRIGKSAKNNMTLSDLLRSYLEKRQLQLILIASPQEWKILQEKDRRFADLFQVLRISEPEMETATQIVLEKRKSLEVEHDTQVSIQAIQQLFTIQRNYLKNKALPGSVIQLLQQLVVKYRSRLVDVPEVREEFKVFSGLQEKIFDNSQLFEKEEVDVHLAQSLVGQPKAVAALSEIVHLIKARLVDKSKPISSLMFIGPTGVGKTQAAKVLCQYLMGSEDHLLRFDMNEYIDEYAVQRLIGDYYQPAGQLTGKVRYQPFSVLLLDEIEKAHPKIHDLLLQVLDDGRLTDSLGRTVDFTNTIIIMTSNIGAREVGQKLGYQQGIQEDNAIYKKAVANYFRPEFINRIDKTIIFTPLSLDHILGIARLQIKELLQRDGFVRRTTILNISQDALEWVAQRGFNERMGGRALKRQIEKDLTALTAEQLIRTHTENPIVFDILLDGERLLPSITPLDFATPLTDKWLPPLPDEKKGKKFYRTLLNAIERLEKRLDRVNFQRNRPEAPLIFGNNQEAASQLNWQYYYLKDKIRDTKEHIQTIMLGFQEKHFAEAPAIPLRLKRGHLIIKKETGTRGIRENIKDRLFQEEGLMELSQAYQFANAQFDSLKTEFINNYLNVSILQLFAEGFHNGEPDRICLSIRSLITGLGDWEIQFLLEKYGDLLEDLGLNYKIDKKECHIVAEGYGLSKFLSSESGIHLFYLAHLNPLPIRVEISGENSTSSGENNYKVIRIYAGRNTLTDLRSSFSNDLNFTPQELKILLYAGWWQNGKPSFLSIKEF